MMYDVVQQSLEEFVQAQWGNTTQIAYDNVEFNSELYNEFMRMNVVFGDGMSRTITQGCFRQKGLLLLSIFTKPGKGTARQLELAKQAADMVKQQEVSATLPLVAPVVKLKVPDLIRDNKERLGWVMAQVSCPFYYDF